MDGSLLLFAFLLFLDTRDAYGYSCREFVPVLGTILAMRDQLGPREDTLPELEDLLAGGILA